MKVFFLCVHSNPMFRSPDWMAPLRLWILCSVRKNEAIYYRMGQFLLSTAPVLCAPLLFFFFNDYWVAGEISHCDVRLFTTEIHPGPLFEIFFEKQTLGLQLGLKSLLNFKFKRLNFKWNLIKFHVDHLGRWLKASNEWKMAICWKNVEKKKTFCWRSRRLAF